jgi:hypothetical protein
MTEQELGRLFEAGHRGGGPWCGITWVRSWVRRTHRLIDVESHPGPGTTVNIQFQIDPQLVDRVPPGGEPR